MAVHTIMVPGLACSARLYQDLVPAVWSYGPVTLADNRRDDTIAAMADRLLADAPQRFALLGVSMGGYVALQVLDRAPQRVTALALISTSARPDTPEQAASRRQQIQLVRDGGFDQLVETVFPALVDESNRSSRMLAQRWHDMAHDVGPDAFVGQLRAALGRADARAVLPGIDCPTAVIHGRGDRFIPSENGEELADGIPGATLTLVEPAGHMVLHEQPEAVAEAVTTLLDRLD